MREIGVGIIGFGTIGAGVAQVILENEDVISRRLGAKLKLVKIADLDIETDRGVKIDKALLSTDVNDVLENPAIDLVVELVGGYEPAKTFVLKAMKNGKHVVTANKALMAVHGDEILAASKETGSDIAFEAAVGGGIPILRAVREGMAANNVKALYGILNGTTNYILTEMKEKGESFERVLAEAQRLGYAEADPTFDVEGIDAAHKITLLATMAFGQKVEFDEVFTEGIGALTPQDIEYAREFGFEAKLLAIAKFDGEQVEARVHPTLIPIDHLLSSVRGVYNAVYADADFLGPTMYYGQGAGREATASAVVGDLIELARDVVNNVTERVPPLAFMTDKIVPAKMKPMGEVRCHYYMRFLVLDKPGVLSQITGVLGKYSISVESVVQKSRDAGQAVPLVMLTHDATEADVNAALKEIAELGVTEDAPVVIRVEV
jgi:homoserine dehydrogenase